MLPLARKVMLHCGSMAKDPVAVKLAGRRMRKLSPARRREIARGAARARWDQRAAAAKRASAPPIEQIAAERAARIPDEEWDRLPEDLLQQLDHYLYGVPKR